MKEEWLEFNQEATEDKLITIMAGEIMDFLITATTTTATTTTATTTMVTTTMVSIQILLVGIVHITTKIIFLAP